MIFAFRYTKSEVLAHVQTAMILSLSFNIPALTCFLCDVNQTLTVEVSMEQIISQHLD